METKSRPKRKGEGEAHRPAHKQEMKKTSGKFGKQSSASAGPLSGGVTKPHFHKDKKPAGGMKPRRDQQVASKGAHPTPPASSGQLRSVQLSS